MKNLNRNLISATYLVKICPLCKSKKSKAYKYFYYNRYSEEFSNLLGIDQEYLMENSEQRVCQNCNLIYKKRWFKKDILKTIYVKKVPIHPNGWDVSSNKFSKKNFLFLINKLKKSKNKKKINILQRTIISILQSIEQSNNLIKNNIKIFTEKIEKNNLNNTRILQTKIIKYIDKPKAFSRFTGFNNEELLKFLQRKIGIIKNYTEIGCPLWGLFRTIDEKKIKKYFIKPDYNFFWGKKCELKSKNCLYGLNKNNIISLKDSINNYDYIGIYNYIDHINNLSFFINKVFKKFNYVGIIQEDKARGYPIQHNYGINLKCMQYIAKKFKKKLILNKKLFKDSKYNFYLFT